MSATEPLFSCEYTDCATHCSYPASELRVSRGKRVCDGCYDCGEYEYTEDENGEPVKFYDLPPFVSDQEAELIALRAELKGFKQDDLAKQAESYRLGFIAGQYEAQPAQAQPVEGKI